MMRRPGGWTYLLAGVVLLLIGTAGDVVLGGDLSAEGLLLPVACQLGKTCWVVNYVDVDPTPRARDSRCRFRTYEGHDGVDVAIRDLAVMADGIPVLASASGVVKSVRDGMEDIAVTDERSRRRVSGRECGNGVLLTHEGGWETQYCHLRQGSVSVAPGTRVEAGMPLGLVGLSGKTEFPHVHLTVRRHGTAMDPFTGLAISAGCGHGGTPLWRTDQRIAYEPVSLFNAGFAVGKPDIDAIRSGMRGEGPYPTNAPALVLWADIFGVEAGDRIRFEIAAPDGRGLFDYEQRVEKTQARRFVFAGTPLTGAAWPSGEYIGKVSIVRGDWRAAISTGVRVQ